jgi:hypothetical protein
LSSCNVPRETIWKLKKKRTTHSPEWNIIMNYDNFTRLSICCGRESGIILLSFAYVCRWKIHLRASSCPRGWKDGMDIGAAQNILASHHLDQLKHNLQQAWKLNIVKL